MKHDIFFEHINDEDGRRALEFALDSLVAQLPKESHLCGCVHKTSGFVRTHLQITIDGEPYGLDWSGSRLLHFAQFIESNLVPILSTWKRSLPEFFRSISTFSPTGERICRPETCPMAKHVAEEVG